MNRLLLDCTLRDGGYVNDWEFGHDKIVEIFELLSQGFNRYQEVKDKRDDLLEKINDQYDALKHLLADKDLVIHDKNISILKRIHLLIEEIRKID